MMLFSVLLTASVLLYSLSIFRRLRAWSSLPETNLPAGNVPDIFISVIIPVRNEAATLPALLRDLSNQQYPADLFEVIVVDDHSEDGTAALAAAIGLKTSFPLQVIRLSETGREQGKKAAVKAGILMARGKLVALTDGDCRVQPQWLALLEYTCRQQQAKFISGPVCLQANDRWFEKMQVVEFASLIGIGAASIALQKPNMCNGANLAYEKEAFEEVNGFSGNETIASGDDEFLMHKIAEKWPGKVVFLKAPEATVFTAAQPDPGRFITQRVRWASKWKSYRQLHVQGLALLVFLVNFLLFLAIPLVMLNKIPFYLFIAAYLVKFATDSVFLIPVLRFFGQQKLAGYILLIQLFYLPYVVLTAIAGLLGNYSWKGRKVKN